MGGFDYAGKGGAMVGPVPNYAEVQKPDSGFERDPTIPPRRAPAPDPNYFAAPKKKFKPKFRRTPSEKRELNAQIRDAERRILEAHAENKRRIKEDKKKKKKKTKAEKTGKGKKGAPPLPVYIHGRGASRRHQARSEDGAGDYRELRAIRDEVLRSR